MKTFRFVLPLLLLTTPAFAAPLGMEQVPSSMQQVEPPSAAPVDNSIMGQIARCWTAPPLENGKNLPPPTLNVTLNREGNATNIDLDPKSQKEFEKNPAYRDLVMSAIMAVKNCMPLHSLPPEDYEKWRSLQLVFNPSLPPPAALAPQQ